MSSKYLQAISASFGLLSLGAAIAASGAQPAAASAETPSKQVSYADLNLASAEGVRALKARVRRAASSLCTSNANKPLAQMQAERACVRTAIAGASGQIDLAVARFERQQYARAKYIEIASRR